MEFWFHRILSKYDTEEESRKCKLVSPGKYPDWRGDERKYFLGRKKGRKRLIKKLLKAYKNFDDEKYRADFDASFDARFGIDDGDVPEYKPVNTTYDERYFSSCYRKHSIMLDPYLKKLEKKYNIRDFFNGQKMTDTLYHSEEVDHIRFRYDEDDGELIEDYDGAYKDYQKYLKKHKKRIEAAKELDKKATRGRKVDLLSLAATMKNEKDGWSFDPMEIVNLDTYLPYLLYPRIKHFSEEMCGWSPAYHDTFKAFKKDIKRILKALELQILQSNDLDVVIESWVEEHGGTPHDEAAIEIMIDDEIRYGYHCLAECIHEMWL